MNDKIGHPQISGAHHLALSVKDLDRSIVFYCDVLGAALIRDTYGGDSPAFSGRMAIVAFGTFGLDLIEHGANDGGSFDPARRGLDHLSFYAESVPELQQWASCLDTHDVSHSGVKDVAGVGGMLNFLDPDGIQLEFVFVDPEKLSQGSYATD